MQQASELRALTVSVFHKERGVVVSMLRILFFALFLFPALNAAIVKNNFIVFSDAEPLAKLNFAWAFEGVSGIDYSRMLNDSNYSDFIRNLYGKNNSSHANRSRNYIVNSEGVALYRVSNEASDENSDAVTVAKSWAATDSFQLIDSEASNMLALVIQGTKGTKKINFFKRLKTELDEMNLQFIPEINVTFLNSFYEKNLKEIYGNQFPTSPISYSYEIKSFLPNAEQRAFDFMCLASYSASAPAVVGGVDFSHKGEGIFGVKVLPDSKVELKRVFLEGYP